MNILFRCDGSEEIGMGHVVRCLALADELHDNYACNITFAMRRSELGIRKVKDAYPVIVVEKNNFDFNYGAWLTSCIHKTNAEILIMDMRDGLSGNTLRRIKQSTGVKVVTIDDPEDKRLEADLAFYPPVPQVREMNWDDYKGKLYTGWEYVILRKEFLKTYSKPKNDVPNILVSMGATDPKKMTVFVAETLAEIRMPFHAQIIVGNGYEHKEKLFEKLSRVKFPHQVLVNPPNIAELMSKADLAIISFGQTAFELAALGIPAIYLCITEDHSESTKPFIENNYGTCLGIYGKLDRNCIKEEITTHISNLRVNDSTFKLKTNNLFNNGRICQLVNDIV